MAVRTYSEELPKTLDEGIRSICLSALVSGSVAALQAYNINLFLPWVAAAAVASAIDVVVGPIFRQMATACKSKEVNLEFEFQVAKTIAVIGLTYVTVLPSIGAAAAVAMSVNVFVSTLVTIVANYINQKSAAPLDQRSFTYWLIPSGHWAWATRLGAAAIVT
jgi:hypothetical protein